MKPNWRGWCLAGLLLAGAAQAEENVILIKTQGAYNLTGGDDLAHLKRLTAGVGWEFEPNADTAAQLKRIGIKYIRCINVDPLPGNFTPEGKFQLAEPDPKKPLRLDAHLNTCREVGASPHVIIGTSLHPDLRYTAPPAPEGAPGIMGQAKTGRIFGPNDPKKYIAYCEAYFEYVLVTQNFPDARFEFGNEPDIQGQFPYPQPPLPGRGSRALYNGYLSAYKLAAQAAANVEARNPGLKVRLGGPAVAWAFTYRFGDFNWAVEFIRDCAEQKVKLDFLGIHYYGNISSLDGSYQANFPAFPEMYRVTREARDRYLPGLPIWLTEWGPSYHDKQPMAAVNCDHMGAAWCAAFLDLMLQCDVEGALYLVTTDRRVQNEKKEWENLWGWPALFANPRVFGRAYPKATFHLFDLVSRLTGERIEATAGGATVRGFATADRAGKALRLLVWNYGARLPEGGAPIEQAQPAAVTLRVRDAGEFFASPRVKSRVWMVAAGLGDAFGVFSKGEVLSEANTALPQTSEAAQLIIDGAADLGLSLPPSSVALVEIVPES